MDYCFYFNNFVKIFDIDILQNIFYTPNVANILLSISVNILLSISANILLSISVNMSFRQRQPFPESAYDFTKKKSWKRRSTVACRSCRMRSKRKRIRNKTTRRTVFHRTATNLTDVEYQLQAFNENNYHGWSDKAEKQVTHIISNYKISVEEYMKIWSILEPKKKVLKHFQDYAIQYEYDNETDDEESDVDDDIPAIYKETEKEKEKETEKETEKEAQMGILIPPKKETEKEKTKQGILLLLLCVVSMQCILLLLLSVV